MDNNEIMDMIILGANGDKNKLDYLYDKFKDKVDVVKYFHSIISEGYNVRDYVHLIEDRLEKGFLDDNIKALFDDDDFKEYFIEKYIEVNEREIYDYLYDNKFAEFLKKYNDNDLLYIFKNVFNPNETYYLEAGTEVMSETIFRYMIDNIDLRDNDGYMALLLYNFKFDIPLDVYEKLFKKYDQSLFNCGSTGSDAYYYKMELGWISWIELECEHKPSPARLQLYINSYNINPFKPHTIDYNDEKTYPSLLEALKENLNKDQVYEIFKDNKHINSKYNELINNIKNSTGKDKYEYSVELKQLVEEFSWLLSKDKELELEI
jgi:hypothetical protein